MNRMFYPFAIVAFSVCVFAAAPVAAQLIARTPLPKPVTITKPAFESRLTVKFVDNLKVRAVNSGVVSQVGADIGNVQAVKAQFALTFQPLIQLPQAALNFIEGRAAQRSGDRSARPCRDGGRSRRGRDDRSGRKGLTEPR